MLDSQTVGKLSKKFDLVLQKYTKRRQGEQPKIPAAAFGLTDENETVYINYEGMKNLETNEPLDKNTKFAYYSLTKAMTAFAVLKLQESGKLNIKDNVNKYLPDFDRIYIVDKDTVDAKTGEFLRPPRKPSSPATIFHLLTMTAGLSYPFLNREYFLLATRKNRLSKSSSPSMDHFTTENFPLIGEPGEKFLYGVSLDWVGFVVEKVSGKSLGDYLKEVLFDPVGMDSCTFHVRDASSVCKVYKRSRDGRMKLDPGMPLDPAIDMGGQGCFGNLVDYLKFMRVWINYGYSPDAGRRLLGEDLTRYVLKNHLPPGITVRFELLPTPELKDGFSLAGMGVTGEEVPTGRPVGSVYWSGLGNLYYWIDLQNKIGGFYASQLLPMGDAHSFLAYCKLEMAVYDTFAGIDDDEEEDDDDDDEKDEDEEEVSKHKL